MSAARNFEIVGTYFVDIFYNVLYAKARHQMMASKKQITVTDIYMSLAHQYPQHCAQKYSEVAKMVYNYYLRKSGTPCAFDEFQKALLLGIVPDDYYKLLSVNERDKIMRDALLKLVKSLHSHIVRSGVKFIIDDRTDPIGKDRIRALQNKCVEIFEEIKGEYHVRLNNTATNSVDHRIYEELQHQVSLRVKAEQALAKLTAENKRLRFENDNLQMQLANANKEHKVAKNRTTKHSTVAEVSQRTTHTAPVVQHTEMTDNVDLTSESLLDVPEVAVSANTENNQNEEDLFSLSAEDFDDDEMDKLTAAAMAGRRV